MAEKGAGGGGVAEPGNQPWEWARLWASGSLEGQWGLKRGSRAGLGPQSTAERGWALWPDRREFSPPSATLQLSDLRQVSL